MEQQNNRKKEANYSPQLLPILWVAPQPPDQQD